MKPFKHYILTRFNVGLYNRHARTHEIYQPPDGWMDHRMKLFTTFTLPSIMSQRCQDFTWLVFMDEKTPRRYSRSLEQIGYHRMQLVYVSGEGLDNDCISAAALEHIEGGDGDLITTRIDNDDAFHQDVVATIQQWYAPRPEPWTMVFPSGLILDTASKKLHIMIHWFNNCPTLIENAAGARTVFCNDHSQIIVKVREHIIDKCYWLQVVHSRNVANSLTGTSPSVVIRTDKDVDIAVLADFGIDVESVAAVNV